MKIKLLSPDPGEGGDPVQPSPAPGQPSLNTPPPAPPPAATTVLEGTKTERELQLEEENQRLAKEKKDRETKIAELEDENHRLKAVPADDQPAAEEGDGTWNVFEL